VTRYAVLSNCEAGISADLIRVPGVDDGKEIGAA
jgi:hypothetical protein